MIKRSYNFNISTIDKTKYPTNRELPNQVVVFLNNYKLKNQKMFSKVFTVSAIRTENTLLYLKPLL